MARLLVRSLFVVLVMAGCKDDPAPAGGSSSSSTGEPPPASSEGPGGSGQLDDTQGMPVCESGTWSGILRRGSAWTSFTECGTAETWWLDSAPDDCDDVFLTVEGTLCGPGEYGLQGAYAYILNGVVTDGPCTPDACEGAPTSCDANLCQLQCDLWEQDCPDGQKCIPVTNADAEAPWDGTRCVLLNMDPLGPGAACDYNGLADPCATGWWCLPDMAGSDVGSCVSLCQDDEVCMGGACTDCDGGGAHQFGACDPPAPC